MRYKIYLMIMIICFAFTVNAEGEATIKNIKVNGVACTCTGYDCVVDTTNSSATITYDLVDSNAKVDRLSGFSVDLLSEVTNIKLTVTNSTGETKIENIYNLTINKQAKKYDLSLKSLKVNGETMKVGSEIYSYNYTSEYDAKTIKIDVEANDSTATIVKQDVYEFPLEDGSLAVDFSVKPVSGDAQDYRVVVTRGVKPDTTLKSLKINDKEIKLNEKEFEYELSVDYSVNELDIDAVPANKDAKVEIESKTLVVGENVVKIKISSDRTNSEYILKVTREENIDKSVANLKELEILEYEKLDFDENVLDYTLNFSSVPEKLTITAEAKDPDAQIEIVGNENIKNDSSVVIKVKLEKITREYTLKIKESHSISDNKTVVLVALIGVFVTIIILIILEIHSKKQEKRRYLKKIFDLRHKIERKRKEEKENKTKEEKDKKVKLKIKPKEKVKSKEQVDDDGIEII